MKLTLRATILTSVLVLVVGIIAATVVVVRQVVERSAMRSLGDELLRGRAVFSSLATERQIQLMQITEVVAVEPRLKALAGTDADRRTVVGVAHELHQTVGTDIFVLIDGGGSLIIDMMEPAEEGADMLANPVVAEAFTHGSAAGVWVDSRAAYEVYVQRLRFGAQTIGALALGRAIGGDTAATIYAQTGMSVVVLLDGKPIAISPLPGARGIDAAAVASAVAAVELSSQVPLAVDLDGARFLAIASSFPAYQGKADLRYVLLRSVDTALEPGVQVTRILYVILLIAILCALVLGVVVTRRLSRPLTELCAFAERIGNGELRARSQAHGFAEIERLVMAMNRMAEELQESRIQMAEKERLESELNIAGHIQVSILPRQLGLSGLDVAARMEPADEVGGDYYDVLPTDDGGWLGIGDVAGHGLDAGLIMLMAQTSIATLVAAEPDAMPSELAVAFNQVLYTNLKERLDSDRHMTLCLLRYFGDGRLIMAGAHLEVLYLPVGADRCELIDTPGIWMGMIDDIAPMTFDSTYQLSRGDLLVMYTDGLIEARSPSGEMFGLERVMEIVKRERGATTAAICQSLFEAVHAFAAQRADDITVMVMRYVGED